MAEKERSERQENHKRADLLPEVCYPPPKFASGDSCQVGRYPVAGRREQSKPEPDEIG